MDEKKKRNILFQHPVHNLGKKGGAAMTPETLESLAIKFGLILDYLKEIKEHLSDLPCKDHDSKIAENKFALEYLKDAVAELKKEKDEEIYPRIRTAETHITTLIQQNKGQDAWSAKVWVLILLGIQTVAGIVAYFMTRGV